MQGDAWHAFATNDLRVIDRSPELRADAPLVDVPMPRCVPCLAKALARSLGDVVDEIMSLYVRREVTLNESGHCRACSRRTVVVEKP